jgi:hypothetical protein
MRSPRNPSLRNGDILPIAQRVPFPKWPGEPTLGRPATVGIRFGHLCRGQLADRLFLCGPLLLETLEQFGSRLRHGNRLRHYNSDLYKAPRNPHGTGKPAPGESSSPTVGVLGGSIPGFHQRVKGGDSFIVHDLGLYPSAMKRAFLRPHDCRHDGSETPNIDL